MRVAAPAPRAGAVLARLYDRAGRADDAQGLPCAIRPDRGAGENAVPNPPSYVEARLRLRCSSLFCAPSAAVLVPPTDEPSGHEYGPHESDDHAYADEQIGENDSGAALDGHGARQSGGWPPRFTTS